MKLKTKIVLNDDEELVKGIIQALRDNDGYCPCRIAQTEDTKCKCKQFRDSKELGLCHCGLFKRVEVEE